MSSLYKDKVDSLILQCSLGGVSVYNIPQRPAKHYADTIVNLVNCKGYKVGDIIVVDHHVVNNFRINRVVDSVPKPTKLS